MNQEYIYISSGKLTSLAESEGVDEITKHRAKSRTVSLTASLAPGGVGGSASVSEVNDLDVLYQPEPDFELLRKLMPSLNISSIPSIDSPYESETIGQDEWFRFHREVRFGIGHAECASDKRVFVAVDSSNDFSERAVPGLFLHGSPQHLRGRYKETLVNSASGRSGSKSELIFALLADYQQREFEDNAEVREDIRMSEAWQKRGSSSPDRVLIDVHRMYVLHGVGADPMFRRVDNRHICSGIARATSICTSGESKVVFGSPLYVCIEPVCELETIETRSVRTPGLLQRWFGNPRFELEA